jgi:hypothetical protein
MLLYAQKMPKNDLFAHASQSYTMSYTYPDPFVRVFYPNQFRRGDYSRKTAAARRKSAGN